MTFTYSDRDIPVFEYEQDLFVHYEVHQIAAEPDYVRLACTLLQIDNKGKEVQLAYVRTKVTRETNYTEYIQENARDIFRRPLKKNPDTETLYQQLYGGNHPFESFVAMNFETVSRLHAWEASTHHQYYLTLRQLSKYLPHKPLTQLQGKDFDVVIQTVEELYAEKQQEKKRNAIYSESRINQFLITLNAIMAFAAVALQIRNPLLDCERYQARMRGRKEKQRSIETLVENYLRPKELQTKQQIQAAADIMGQIQAGDPYAIGVGIQELSSLRPSEVCGIRWTALIPFTREGWQDRHCLLIYSKVLYRGEETSYRLKTLHGYRAIPVHIDLQSMLNIHMANVRDAQETKEEFGKRFIVETERKSKKAVKTEVFCRHSKKILQTAAKGNAELFSLQLPVEIDDAGLEVRLEDDETAYRWRHNGGSMWLNEVGLPYGTVQAFYGHKPSEEKVLRWFHFHEDELIEQLQEMDKLVFFPAKNREEIEWEPWRRMDPREEIHVVDGCCTFENFAAGSFLVQPYSDTDQVTIQLVLKANEPGDSITYNITSDEKVEMEVDSVFFRSTGPERVNLWNDYWDRVYKDEEKDSEGIAKQEVLDEETDEVEECEEEIGVFENPDSDVVYIEDDAYQSPDEDDWIVEDFEDLD